MFYLIYNSGSIAFGENGIAQFAEHLPEAGDRSDAESYHTGAKHTD